MLRRTEQRFLRAEDGAVTVDWIVLTASVIGLGFAAVSMIGGDTTSLTARINEQMSAEQAQDGAGAVTGTTPTGELTR